MSTATSTAVSLSMIPQSSAVSSVSKLGNIPRYVLSRWVSVSAGHIVASIRGSPSSFRYMAWRRSNPRPVSSTPPGSAAGGESRRRRGGGRVQHTQHFETVVERGTLEWRYGFKTWKKQFEGNDFKKLATNSKNRRKEESYAMAIRQKIKGRKKRRKRKSKSKIYQK